MLGSDPFIGTKADPFFSTVEEFVTWSGGDHAIKKILIANNGIGATKAIKSIRKWAFSTFGNERMISFVVMASPEDMKANAEYIRLADHVVDVPGGTNNNNYANINLICQIAERLKVDAVMPMWGHASENPLLPTSLLNLKRRVTFIGPPAEPMQALGDKIGSTIIAQSAGVPVIAWNGDGIQVDYKKEGIPQAVFDKANVQSAEDALACCERIGYPVMIKASEGGGGKGIRKVFRSEDVMSSFRQVQGEIPGSPIFVMKMASHARHLEVQLLADKHGDAIALSGRDCSVQRRHQKIIEEGPPNIASPQLFRKMENAAIALAKTVGYCNTGTVEYLYMVEDESFAFLELNPRLQVEHPVTENIMGMNLPSCQLMVAMGIPLHRIGDVRRLYGRHVRGTDTIDFAFAEKVVPPRHCIAVRVTAENPDAGFQPTGGRIEELHFHSSIDVWGYFSVNNSGNIHEYADSQFGHIFASGKDRESARRSLIVALKELQIRGKIRTTTEYIMKLLQSDGFINNTFNTDWLDGRIANHTQLAIEENRLYFPDSTLVATCGAAVQCYQGFRVKDSEFIDMLKIGQIPTKEALCSSMDVQLIFNNIKYSTICHQTGPEKVEVVCNDTHLDVFVRQLADGGFLLSVGGHSHVAYTSAEEGGDGAMRMILDGNTCIFTPEYDPTQLRSPVAGKIARLLVSDGTHIEAGEPYAEVEVMKMYMSLKALEAGTVHFLMSDGATLSVGDVIGTVDLDNPDAVVKSESFTGSIAALAYQGGEDDYSDEENDGEETPGAAEVYLSSAKQHQLSSSTEQANEAGGRTRAESSAQEDALVSILRMTTTKKKLLPHVMLRETFGDIDRLMQGYPLTKEDIANLVPTLTSCFADKALPAFKTEEALAVLRGRIDATLAHSIQTLVVDFRNTLSTGRNVKFPASRILGRLQAFANGLSAEQRPVFIAQTQELWAAVEPFVYCPEEIVLSHLVKYLDTYLSVERIFDAMSFTDVVSQLRKEHNGDLTKVLDLCRSHLNVESKNIFLLELIDNFKTLASFAKNIKRPELPSGIVLRGEVHTRKLRGKLTELAKLKSHVYSRISFSANLLLIDQFSVTVEIRRQKLNDCIDAALTSGEELGQDHGDRTTHIKKFIDNNIIIRDILIESLRHDRDYQMAALEVYLRKIYQKTHELYNMTSGSALRSDNSDQCSWIQFDFSTKAVEAVLDGDLYRNPAPVDFGLYANNQSDTLSIGMPLTSADETTPVKGMITPTHKNESYLDMADLSQLSQTGAVRGKFDQALATARDIMATDNETSMSSYIVPGNRSGVIALLENLSELPSFFPLMMQKIPEGHNTNPVNVLHVIVLTNPAQPGDDDDDVSMRVFQYLDSVKEELRIRNIRRVTFFLSRDEHVSDVTAELTGPPPAVMPLICTYRLRTEFTEDVLLRHTEAPHAFHLDLTRLSNFKIQLADAYQTSAGNIHLYKCIPKDKKTGDVVMGAPSRYFARLVSFVSGGDAIVSSGGKGKVHSNDLEVLFVEALDHIALALSKDGDGSNATAAASVVLSNHVFINIVSPDTVIELSFYDTVLRNLNVKYGIKMVRLAISAVELKLTCKLTPDTDAIVVRLVATNPTGSALKVEKYYEAYVDGKAVFKSLSRTHKGPWDGLDTNTPYEVCQQFEKQRALAMSSSDTLYVYDWPVIFESATERLWEEYDTQRFGKNAADAKEAQRARRNQMNSKGLKQFTCTELVLCDVSSRTPIPAEWSADEAQARGVMIPLPNQPAGSNHCGMVAWLFRTCTPECPGGREFVVICNDITFQAGSFGTKEDVWFLKASEFARHHGIPRLYLTANSGARIGMAQSLKSKFEVCWGDDKDPSKGFKYLYFSEGTYQAMLEAHKGDVDALPVRCEEEVTASGQKHYKITDIIGDEPDLGVENLQGSGAIAGETSRAYDDIFTLTLVVGRAVGIGAYLVRLGQRTIQKSSNAPIILTGYQALNKLMGRDIYTTNDQLGGPMIMFNNGVSHLLAQTHLDTVVAAMDWMAYVPAKKGDKLPVRSIAGIDSIDRLVEFRPPKGVSYDPRYLLCGVQGLSWQSGFFDKDSFVETLSGWAKTVVVGRGRLGGLPIGCIVTENRTAEMIKPADPADMTSQERLVQQAGGVWFPDSAAKTAQALRDFNREGIPCIIFANWRGFSGGQRDMFDEVLKFGSMIVDALVAYQQPLFVYIPPFAELRGGAWVVVDSSINSDVMEFYAAEDARGGVLEAAGAASIKFRQKDVVTAAHRLDGTLQQLDAQLASASGAELATLKKQILARERLLMGVYQQVAVHFADLHDTPGRMQAKGVIRRQVQWAESRQYFYWRLRRRLEEFDVARRMAFAVGDLSGGSAKVGNRAAHIEALRKWVLSVDAQVWDNDRAMVEFFTEKHTQDVNKFVQQYGGMHPAGDRSAIMQALIAMSEADRAKLLADVAAATKK